MNHIDLIIKRIGQLTSWLSLLMVVVMVSIILLRSLFDLGWIWLQEIVVWMHASLFMLGAAWTLQTNKHVRVDIFYTDFSPHTKALVDFIGGLLLLIPFCCFIIWVSFHYVQQSWIISEASREAGGLPALYLFKTLIPVFALLLILQAVSLLYKNLLAMRSPRTSQDRNSQ